MNQWTRSLRLFTNASVPQAITRLVVMILLHQRYKSQADEQDYLYGLAESVRELYPHVRDAYLFSLEVSLSRSLS